MEEFALEKQSYPVWSTPQIVIATLLGGPPAGCYLISGNYKAMSNPLYAKRALWSGIIGIALLFLACVVLDTFFHDLFEKIPGSVVAATTCIAVWSHAGAYQKKAVAELRKAGNPRNSYFKLIPVILLSLLHMFGAGMLFWILSTL